MGKSEKRNVSAMVFNAFLLLLLLVADIGIALLLRHFWNAVVDAYKSSSDRLGYLIFATASTAFVNVVLTYIFVKGTDKWFHDYFFNIPQKESDGKVRAGMEGKVWRIEKKVGDIVKKGDVIVVLDAMKMEVPLTAPVDGAVAFIECSVGDTVEAGQVVAILY